MLVTPLKQVREKSGKTAAQVARAVGVTQVQISRIENGKSTPRPELAKRLAAYFGNITRDQILFPEEYVGPTTKRPSRSIRAVEAP